MLIINRTIWKDGTQISFINCQHINTISEMKYTSFTVECNLVKWNTQVLLWNAIHLILLSVLERWNKILPLTEVYHNREIEGKRDFGSPHSP